VKLAVIAGDGIGPEVVGQAVKVLDAVLPGVEKTSYDLGARRYHATGEVLPDSVLDELRGHDAILLGAIGDPSVPSGVLERGLLLAIRFALDAIRAQPLGYLHALFEVALDVLKRSKDINSPAAIRDSILATNYNSIVGPIAWHGQPVKNVTKTPLVGGQWIPGSQFKGGGGQHFKYDLVIVNNEHDPTIGLQRKLEPLS